MKITKALDADQVRILRRGSDDLETEIKAIRSDERALEGDHEELEARIAHDRTLLDARASALTKKRKAAYARELELVAFVLRGDGYKPDFLPSLKVSVADASASWDDGKPAPKSDTVST